MLLLMNKDKWHYLWKLGELLFAGVLLLFVRDGWLLVKRIMKCYVKSTIISVGNHPLASF